MKDTKVEATDRVVLIFDDRPLRREAYVSLLTPWASQQKLRIIARDGLIEEPVSRDTAIIVISAGSRSITELRLRGELWSILPDTPPAVVISDLDDPTEIAAALKLGVRGFVPTALAADLALNTLTFVLSGGEFFPASALQPRGDPGPPNGEDSR